MIPLPWDKTVSLRMSSEDKTVSLRMGSVMNCKFNSTGCWTQGLPKLPFSTFSKALKKVVENMTSWSDQSENMTVKFYKRRQCLFL